MQSPQYARPQEPASYATAQDQSPKTPVPKNVAFELLLDENSKVRARIPMRVQIYPHDTTDSIVTTVKNFYGIYDNHASGVSFEDENGITLIARFENLRNNMTVYVRVIPVQAYGEGYSERFYGAASASSSSYPIDSRSKRPSLGEPFQMPSLPAAQESEHAHLAPPSRPTSRVTNNKRSASPSARSRRSVSHKAGGSKGRGPNGTAVHDDDNDVYSDSEDEYGSNCSRKTKNELFASSDISMENILHDGRRKRPKFESSELPLFVPPQVPITTSTSSISPQRQSIVHEGAGSPFARPTHRPYAYQPLPSPQSYGHSEHAYGTSSSRNTAYATPMVPEHGQRSRDRTTTQSSGQFSNPVGQTNGPGVLPTPDPTIASCISDEDVAMQLIRLGDASNFSHGRTSASTLDDAFSGAADAASSTGATSDGDDFSEEEDDLPARTRQRLDSSPMLPPGTTKRTHKRLDDILPSFDSSDASDDDYHHGEPTESMVKSEMDEDTTYKEMAPKAKKIKSRATSTVSNGNTNGNNNTFKSRNPNKLPSARPGKTASSSSATTATTTNKSSSTGANSRKIKPSSSSSINGGSQKPMTHAHAHAPTVPGDGMVSPAPTRKTSMSSVTNSNGTNLQSQLAADEEDLSTKPRCQRCRKSKKGCDRQRPCGRCKDAGIGIEGCISEDEGNGRKGRYGRHMGVPVKKTSSSLDFASSPVEALPVASFASADKNKKRKR